MSKVSYPWVWVRVEFCTHRLYGYEYGIALPCLLPSLVMGHHVAPLTCLEKVWRGGSARWSVLQRGGGFGPISGGQRDGAGCGIIGCLAAAAVSAASRSS
jgi:hypothetical protein